MGNELARGTGRYWILYYQPLPESGERIAVALAVEDSSGRVRIEYDRTFAKALRIFPDTDPECLALVFDGFKETIDGTLSPVDQLNALGPQIAVSHARRISLPVAPAVLKTLLSRYVYPPKKERQARKKVDKVAGEIEAFVKAASLDVELRRNVGPRDILGYQLAGAKRLALAVPNGDGWTLIDGIDLNQLSPTEAAHRADEISRTFWNYSRVAGERGVDIRTVGVVLNGNSHKAPKTHEAHDYAVHRFRADSSLAIDAASTEAQQQLRRFLSRQ